MKWAGIATEKVTTKKKGIGATKTSTVGNPKALKLAYIALKTCSWQYTETKWAKFARHLLSNRGFQGVEKTM